MNIERFEGRASFSPPLGVAVKSDPRFRSTLPVIGYVDVSPAGNIIVKTGEAADDGWVATQHIVLSPSETDELIETLHAARRPQEGNETT